MELGTKQKNFGVVQICYGMLRKGTEAEKRKTEVQWGGISMGKKRRKG